MNLRHSHTKLISPLKYKNWKPAALEILSRVYLTELWPFILYSKATMWTTAIGHTIWVHDVDDMINFSVKFCEYLTEVCPFQT